MIIDEVIEEVFNTEHEYVKTHGREPKIEIYMSIDCWHECMGQTQGLQENSARGYFIHEGKIFGHPVFVTYQCRTRRGISSIKPAPWRVVVL